MYFRGIILDVRFAAIGDGQPRLEILRGTPVVDASGAICGVEARDAWEAVATHHYGSAQSYRELSDLASSGGIVDAP